MKIVEKGVKMADIQKCSKEDDVGLFACIKSGCTIMTNMTDMYQLGVEYATSWLQLQLTSPLNQFCHTILSIS